MSKKCPICGRSVAYRDYIGGTSFIRCDICGYGGCDFENITIFDHITRSPRDVGREVYFFFSRGERYRRRRRCETVCYEVWWSALTGEEYHSKAEAFDATLKKLKETYNE